MKTLISALGSNGKIPFGKWGEVSALLLSSAARSPFSVAEKLYVKRLIKPTPEMSAPIFIVGYWRSGTTHLYNILSKAGFAFVDPFAAGMPWNFMVLGKMLAPILKRTLPGSRYIDNVPVLPDSPQEDEIAIANMNRLSFFHGIYFPQKLESNFNEGVFFDGCSKKEIRKWQEVFGYFLKKLSLHQGGKQLLIKNPVYTARVALLHEMMPQAKFIHIHRNPYDVFPSMRNFFDKLLAQFALQPYQDVNIDEIILSSYKRMMTQLEEDKEKLPQGNYVALSYDELDRNPINSISYIYKTLGLSGFDEARVDFEKYLASVRNYKKNDFKHPNEMIELVDKNWGGIMKQLGYD